MTQPNRRIIASKAAALRGNVNRAKQAVHDHKVICATCHNPDNWPHKACDAGWKLAKQITRAENDLAIYTGDGASVQFDGQETLW